MAFPIPNLNLNTQNTAGPSSASSAGSQFGTGWNVNTGGGSAGGVPSWVLYAGAAVVAYWLWKRSKGR